MAIVTVKIPRTLPNGVTIDRVGWVALWAERPARWQIGGVSGEVVDVRAGQEYAVVQMDLPACDLLAILGQTRTAESEPALFPAAKSRGRPPKEDAK